MRLRLVILGAIMVGICSILTAVGIREQRDYDYILDLYSRQNDTEALLEIESFISEYPTSSLKPLVLFMQAEIYYYQSRYAEAVTIYARVLDQDLPAVEKAELILHYGISSYFLKDYHQARELFQRLSSDFDFDQYRAEAAKWMARIFAEGGQYHSAYRYYNIALETFPSDGDLKLELFSSLLNLARLDEARQYLSQIQSLDPRYNRYIEALLTFFINNELYSEFDDALADYQIEPASSTDKVKLLVVRRYLLQNKYGMATEYLDGISLQSPHSRYYKAVILKASGNAQAADSIFALLVLSQDRDISLLSYLERLKIVFEANPVSATNQLKDFIETNPGSDYMGDLAYLAGYFAYHQDDYLAALRYLNRSRNFDLNKYQLDRVDAMTAESWMRLENWDQADERFNRYLNLHPQGLYRDRAWFNLGLIAFERKDYNQSRLYFQNLSARHPVSDLRAEARFYMAELDFYQANYNLAIAAYRALLNEHPIDDSVRLRLAQSHYFNQNYSKALALVDSLTTVDYDSYLLRANIHFNSRTYTSALESFQLAFSFAASDQHRRETQSYIALTLYQLGRFAEASALYLQLAGENADPDTYLFLAAKSAMQSGSFRQASELYDRLLQDYPQSSHYASVLADIATMEYNRGDFERSFDTWKSLLRRFSSKRSFTQAERSVLRETFTGLELCLLRDESMDAAESLVDIIDIFASDYIRFELQYIMVKLYASRDQWQALLREAEAIRSVADPGQRSEIELLMVESLIQLNQKAEASDLLEEIYSSSQSNAALLKLAELRLLEGNALEALDLYLRSLESIPDAEVWYKVLECSQLLDYANFDEYWSNGSSLLGQKPTANLIRLDYLLASERYEGLITLADSLLEQNLSDYIHARAYLSLAEAGYRQLDYHNALRSLNRIRLFFPDFIDVIQKTAYLQIKSLILSGAVVEAQLRFWEDRVLLGEDQFHELNSFFEGLR